MSELERHAAQDLGAQAERTHLAWTRTGLAFAAVAALIMRGAARNEAIMGMVAVPSAVAALAVLAHGPRRYRQTRRLIASARSPAVPRVIAATTIAAFVVSVNGLLTVFLTR